MSDSSTHARGILHRCLDLGFARAGIARAGPSDHAVEYRAWIAEGKHGEMAYLARNVEMRLDPRELVPGARSVICVADRHPGHTVKHKARKAKVNKSATSIGKIARYARGEDYHNVMKRRLHTLCDELRAAYPDETFRACVDTAPVLEREHAERAGIGSIGKNTLIIDPGVGSYLLLGEVITTLELTPSPPAPPDPCGSCTRCIDACPTDAITPWSVDATKCISYLTIEHRSDIDAMFHDSMASWIFGCDVCQEVCPHNQPTWRTRRAPSHPAYTSKQDGFDLLEVLGWSEEDRRAAFRGTALKRAKLDMIKRNARIVLDAQVSNGNTEAESSAR